MYILCSDNLNTTHCACHDSVPPPIQNLVLQARNIMIKRDLTKTKKKKHSCFRQSARVLIGYNPHHNSCSCDSGVVDFEQVENLQPSAPDRFRSRLSGRIHCQFSGIIRRLLSLVGRGKLGQKQPNYP